LSLKLWAILARSARDRGPRKALHGMSKSLSGYLKHKLIELFSMSTEDLIMTIDKPTYQVKLHSNLLEVDLKGEARKALEDAVEANPALRGSLGFIFQTIIPLDVPLKDIEKVELDKKQQVKIRIPHRRDITIPLEPEESRRLVEKLNDLIPVEKRKELERLVTSQQAKRDLTRERSGEEQTAARMMGRERE
jgi:hypothetical protein